MGEVLTQVWLKSTSEYTKREFVKILPEFMQAHKNVLPKLF